MEDNIPVSELNQKQIRITVDRRSIPLYIVIDLLERTYDHSYSGPAANSLENQSDCSWNRKDYLT